MFLFHPFLNLVDRLPGVIPNYKGFSLGRNMDIQSFDVFEKVDETFQETSWDGRVVDTSLQERKLVSRQSNPCQPGRQASGHDIPLLCESSDPNVTCTRNRGHRPRICYNCRRPGHEARNCDKPNPRMEALNATANTLSVGIVDEEEETCPWELEYQASLLKAQNESSIQRNICKNMPLHLDIRSEPVKFSTLCKK